MQVGRSNFLRRFLFATSCSMFFIGGVSADVVLFDGFGDADLNNNGTALEAADIDIDRSSTDPVDPMDITSYEPPEFPGTVVNEVDSVLDAGDTGLKWFGTRGWTSSPPFQPKANIKIVNDAAGLMPDSTHPTYPVDSLDSGYALAWDSKGRGASAGAFFGESVALGPEVGDQVRVSFDYRTWLSGPNQNDFTPPRGASLRFGLFQDTDGQLGTESPFAGMPNSMGIPTPAVWGEADGHFRGDFGTVGANEDHGWYTITDLGRADDTSLVASDFDGLNARINEETNESDTGGRFLEGSDNDFVAKPDALAPDFLALDVTKAYNLSLTLERATDTVAGDTIKAIYVVTEKSSGQMWTLEGQEPLMRDDGMGGLEADGISSDSWDYFGIRSTTSIASDGDDFDMLLDNFMVEIFGSNASGLDCDFNSDSECLIDDLDLLYAELGTNNATFDLDASGTVDGDDIDEWLTQASDADPQGRTFKDGDTNLDGDVGGTDFTNLAVGFGMPEPATWGQGNFDGMDGVGGADFTALAVNFGFTSSAVSSVPEPSTWVLLLISAVASLGCFRKR